MKKTVLAFLCAFGLTTAAYADGVTDAVAGMAKEKAKEAVTEAAKDAVTGTDQQAAAKKQAEALTDTTKKGAADDKCADE